MSTLIVIVVVVAVLVLLMLVLAVRIVRQYERGVAHPLALQLRNLQSLIEIGVDKNTTVMFPVPLMSTGEELAAFLTREHNAAHCGKPPAISYPNGTVAPTR